MSWRRKKLYLLFAQHRYISRLFSVLIGSDIADKLYALNDRVYTGKTYHYDIRLPNFYQMSSPKIRKSPLTEHFRNSKRGCDKWYQSRKFYNHRKDPLRHSPNEIQKIALTIIFINETQRQDATASCLTHLSFCIVNKVYKFLCISYWNKWGGGNE